MGNGASHSRCQFCGERFRSTSALHNHRIAKGHMTRTMELPSSAHRTETKMQHGKPEYSYSHAIIKAGHTMPEALLSKLIAENRTAIGCGIRTQKAMEKEVFFPAAEGKSVEETLAFMKQWMEATKAFTRLVSFHSLPEEFDEDVEIMPWAPIKDSKGNSMLYVAIDGDFPQHIDSSSDHFSESFKVLGEFLGPKVDTIYGTSGNRPDKLFEYLKSDDFGRDFEQIVGHRGVLTFLPVTGEAFVQGKNEIGVRGDWGLASVAYGYTETVTETASPAAVEVKPKVTSGKSKYVTEDQPALPSAPQPGSSPPAVPGNDLVEEEKVFTPPLGLHGKKLKEWYRATGGNLPSNWRDKPPVKVLVKKPKAAAPEKKADTAIAAALKAAEVGKSMPILSGDKQKASMDFIKKFVVDGSAIISDPKETNEQEQKLAKWHELHGYKDLSEVNRWTPAFLAAYVKEHPEAAWLLVLAFRSDLNRQAKVIDGLVKGTVTAGELVKTGTEAPGTTTVPASPAPQPEPAPEKKVAAGGKSKYV